MSRNWLRRHLFMFLKDMVAEDALRSYVYNVEDT